MLNKVNVLFIITLLFIKNTNTLEYSEIILNGSLEQISFDIVRKTGSFVYSNCKSFRDNISCNVTETRFGRPDKNCVSTFDSKAKVGKYILKSLTEDKVLISFDVDVVMSAEILSKDTNFVKYREEAIKIRILKTSDCSYKDVSVSGAVLGLLVVNQDGSFNLVYSTEDTVSLGQGTYRVKYDASGQKIRGPESYIVFGLPPDAVVFTQPLLLEDSGSYLHEVTSELQHSLFRVKPNGEAIPIASNKDYLLSTSSAQGVLGVCWVNDSDNVTCRRYDSDAKLKINVDLKILDESNSAYFVWQNPFNLDTGEMLLVGGFMSEISPQSLNFKMANFTMVEIKPDGRYSEPVKIQGLDLECTNKVSPYTSIVLTNLVGLRKNGYCLQFLCAKYLSRFKSALIFSNKCR